MGTYTDWQFRAMAADPLWDRRPAAVPSVPFEQWMVDEQQRRIDDLVAELVADGWFEDEAFIAATQTIENEDTP